ncbi:MAG: hypothetical protein ACOY37_12070 [Pseudomonadota bacterium]
MSKSKKTGEQPTHHETSTQVFKAVDKGQINTQQKEAGELRADKSKLDQSEGSHDDGQPTARHGQGAGFGRNIR